MLANDLYGLALLAIVSWIVLIYFVITYPGKSRSASPPHGFYRARSRFGNKHSPDLTDVRQQLQAVMTASFEPQKLLNYKEFQTFKIIEADIAAARRGYRVFAQTSLGEVLTTPKENGFRSVINDNGFRSINSK